jgi:hypothetical protein
MNKISMPTNATQDFEILGGDPTIPGIFESPHIFILPVILQHVSATDILYNYVLTVEFLL